MTITLRRVCVTGPESTGKTTLAERIAESADTEWVPEASRLYAERKGSELLASDVEPIAREHIALVDAATARSRERGASLLVLDTDLLSTVIYARHYYGKVPSWLQRAEQTRRAELYLLCDIDVPWVADGVRDRPENRDEMFALFYNALVAGEAEFVTIRGDWDQRWSLARDAVAPFLGR